MADKEVLKIRLKLIYVLLFGFTLLIFAFAIRWQVIKGAEFREITDSRIFTERILTSFRGTIFASDGSTLAYSEPRYNVFVWMDDLLLFEEKDFQRREEFAELLSPFLDTTEEELKNRIEDEYSVGVRWIRIGTAIDSKAREDINSLIVERTNKRLRGIVFTPTERRIYPEGDLASHVIGLTNIEEDEIFGVSGIEAAWDGDLKSKDGIIIQKQNAAGQASALELTPTIEAKPGSQLYTSIDKAIQRKVQEELQVIVEQYEAKSGTVVILDPRTGEIISLANYPTFDPNLRDEPDSFAYADHSIYRPIEIGSVMKSITLAAALNENLIEIDSIVQPEGHEGCRFVSHEIPPDGKICTWNKLPQPPMTAKECLIRSDNLCFMDIGQMMDNTTFYEYLVKFGLNEPSGVDLSGESISPIKPPEQWNIADEATFTYGHGFLVNMVQTASAISVIPNKGTRMVPHVVTKVVKADGIERTMEPLAIEDVISPETAFDMSVAMQETYLSNVTEYYYQHLKAYPIGMKTGSALIADPNRPECPYCSGLLNNAIVGFDAADGKFLMLLKLEQPNGGLSFYNVRPGWLQIFDRIKADLGMVPVN